MLCTMFARDSDTPQPDTPQPDTTEVDEPEPGDIRPPAVWRTVLALDAGLVRLVGRLRVTGGIPRELRGRPLLMAANHIGVFDAFVLMAACRRIGLAPRFLLAGGLLDTPVLGRALRASGHLRVDRGKAAAIEQFAAAVEALRATRSPIIVYPEGRISHDPGLWPERGKTGAARLALAAGVPVVPISQWGAHEAVYWGTETVSRPADILPLARSGLTAPLRRPTLRVHFGEPVDLSEFAEGRPGSAVRAHARIMRAITEGLVPLRRDEPDLPRFHDPTRPTDTVSPWKPQR
ncbi:1-acyl-sn-glycerol-3-phosphate acyltransferases [Amycolatopsis arida]|uniref:1-acyl-sn-glycerol-3-phosphate acyltransferases n=1 Tax=Amycolatopsis arida TaxID=587909 RepID=A0A1I5VFP8_9PSEU|nr:lysophospholipid acyltransferase family protein [Amycolatopsis arida]TDX91267.1 1-acyl-sn-glycerol-3-phosphate acyltransferase [Amycolatopsis arida]SFQ06309.1 1-acyl-sn-glycerol-3-phosphate acyltransferases [Amycolatopsis arida]